MGWLPEVGGPDRKGPPHPAGRDREGPSITQTQKVIGAKLGVLE
jgi:hypothetical protein